MSNKAYEKSSHTGNDSKQTLAMIGPKKALQLISHSDRKSAWTLTITALNVTP
jgi:5'-3' exonuclease